MTTEENLLHQSLVEVLELKATVAQLGPVAFKPTIQEEISGAKLQQGHLSGRAFNRLFGLPKMGDCSGILPNGGNSTGATLHSLISRIDGLRPLG